MRRTGEEALRALMLGSLSGDAAAHRALLGELATLLRRYFRSKTGEANDSEDLVQEALIVIHLTRERYDPARPFLAWVLAIARYKWIDFARQRNVRRTETLDEAEQETAEDRVAQASAQMDVARLLSHLPCRQRLAIESTKIEGFSVAEAAERCGTSESSIKVSVHRGLKALARELQGGRANAH